MSEDVYMQYTYIVVFDDGSEFKGEVTAASMASALTLVAMQYPNPDIAEVHVMY